MGEEPDLLSQLPDELLQHILHLAPCREAESTAVLSRRWRGLWPPPTFTVKIDIPCRYKYDQHRLRDASLRSVEEALAAAPGPVERLAIDINVGEYHRLQLQDIVGNALSHPASSGVQDVRIGADTSGDDDGYGPLPNCGVGVFEFSFGVVLPSAALRVLHITNCCNLTPPPPASTFPCLEVLRLRRCTFSIGTVKDMAVASPQLAALQLEYVFLVTDQDYYDSCLPPSICCPGVTTLVLDCCCGYGDVAIDLDMPRVQHFKYRGKISQFTLRSPLPDVRRAYLHILAYHNCSDDKICESIWNFLKNFSEANVLKLKLEWPIDYVADLERWRISDLQLGENQSAQSIRFCAQHLEIDAPYNPESKDTGVAIGNLLQCCPGLNELRLKLKSGGQHRIRRNLSTSLQTKAQLEFHKSIDYFRRRRDHPVVQFCGHDHKFEVSDIPGLSDRCIHFNCLQFHLKRLSLQFHLEKDKPNCIGIRLVKFFIERGMALEEVYIGELIMKLWEHLNCKIVTGFADNHQPFSEYQVLARMSQALSMNQFSSSKINGMFHPQKLQVRRKNPWSTSRSFTILPLADA